jgi:hypothetical protein
MEREDQLSVVLRISIENNFTSIPAILQRFPDGIFGTLSVRTLKQRLWLRIRKKTTTPGNIIPEWREKRGPSSTAAKMRSSTRDPVA